MPPRRRPAPISYPVTPTAARLVALGYVGLVIPAKAAAVPKKPRAKKPPAQQPAQSPQPHPMKVGIKGPKRPLTPQEQRALDRQAGVVRLDIAEEGAFWDSASRHIFHTLSSARTRPPHALRADLIGIDEIIEPIVQDVIKKAKPANDLQYSDILTAFRAAHIRTRNIGLDDLLLSTEDLARAASSRDDLNEIVDLVLLAARRVEDDEEPEDGEQEAWHLAPGLEELVVAPQRLYEAMLPLALEDQTSREEGFDDDLQKQVEEIMRRTWATLYVCSIVEAWFSQRNARMAQSAQDARVRNGLELAVEGERQVTEFIKEKARYAKEDGERLTKAISGYLRKAREIMDEVQYQRKRHGDGDWTRYLLNLQDARSELESVLEELADATGQLTGVDAEGNPRLWGKKLKALAVGDVRQWIQRDAYPLIEQVERLSEDAVRIRFPESEDDEEGKTEEALYDAWLEDTRHERAEAARAESKQQGGLFRNPRGSIRRIPSR